MIKRTCTTRLRIRVFVFNCSRWWRRVMSSLSRAQSWPLLSAAAPAEDPRPITPRTTQIQARRFLCRHYYPEGGWGWVISVCALLVHILNHGLQLSSSQLVTPASKKFHVEPVHPAGTLIAFVIKFGMLESNSN